MTIGDSKSLRVSKSLEEIISNTEARAEEANKRIKEIKKLQRERSRQQKNVGVLSLIIGFLAVVAVLLVANLFVKVYLGYDAIGTIISNISQSSPPSQVQSASAPIVPTLQPTEPPCSKLVTVSIKDDSLTISPIKKGECYQIAPESQTLWTEKFGDEINRRKLSEVLGGDFDSAIKSSLSEPFALDLRSEGEIKPTSFSKDGPVSLKELETEMTNSHIRTVSSGPITAITSFSSDLDSILVVLDPGSLPPSCKEATKVVLSFDKLEGDTMIGNLFIACTKESKNE